MVLGMAGLVRVGVGLATAAYVLAGLAIGGFGPVAAGVAVMLTWAGVVGMPTGWVLAWAGVVGGVGGGGGGGGGVRVSYGHSGGGRARRACGSL